MATITAPNKATGRRCDNHITPPEVATRMVCYLGPVGDFLTLVPSAGTGNLSRALIESGHSQFELVQIEPDAALTAGLHQFGTVIRRGFLEYSAAVRGKVEFPRVLMSPPFSETHEHIAAARALMGSHGHVEPPTLVALVPVTFEMDGMETLEILPEITFTSVNVRTKIIRVRHDLRP